MRHLRRTIDNICSLWPFRPPCTFRVSADAVIVSFPPLVCPSRSRQGRPLRRARGGVHCSPVSNAARIAASFHVDAPHSATAPAGRRRRGHWPHGGPDQRFQPTAGGWRCRRRGDGGKPHHSGLQRRPSLPVELRDSHCLWGATLAWSSPSPMVIRKLAQHITTANAPAPAPRLTLRQSSKSSVVAVWASSGRQDGPKGPARGPGEAYRKKDRPGTALGGPGRPKNRRE